MASYATSNTKMPKNKRHRYTVTYEEDLPSNDGAILTFGVTACSASEATALTIQFIERHKIHTSDFGYTLLPRIGAKITDYNV